MSSRAERTIGLGVVGCGDVAFRTYLPGLEHLGGQARVVSCFDPAAERAERAAALFPGARALGALDDVLADRDVDAILNLTPGPLHGEVNALALESGRHVFSEKPLAATVEEGEALIALSERAGRLLLCAPAVMATPRFAWLSGLVGAGRLGKPTLALGAFATMGPAAWREYTGNPQVFYGPEVGPLRDLGVYVLHAVTGLLGRARRVQALGGIAIPRRDVLIERLAGETIDVTAPDQLLVQLDFGDGVLAQLVAAYTVWATRAPVLELHATRGAFSVPIATWYDAAGSVDLLLDPEDDAAGFETVFPPEPAPYGHLIAAGVPHLVACIRGEARPVLTAAHAVHVLEIVVAAERSLREGCAVELATTF